ncbi:MAG: amylo-alpha-1,6-glucosidase [Eubacteriales bacterium]
MNQSTPFQPMNYQLGKHILTDHTMGESYCYLLSNGLGGYSSLTAIGSCTRHDHGLFLASKVAPTHRAHYVTNLEEYITIGDNTYSLVNQSFATKTNTQCHTEYLQHFQYDLFPTWSYQIEGVEVVKEVFMVFEENTIVVRYQVYSHNAKPTTLTFTPLYRLTDKDDFPTSPKEFNFSDSMVHNKSTNYTCYFTTNAKIHHTTTSLYKDLYYEYDSRDGRDCMGTSVKNTEFTCTISKDYEEFYIVFSDNEKSLSSITDTTPIKELLQAEITRNEMLVQTSQLTHPVAQRLVLACDQFLSKRASTNGKTILAGYPFFGDWGRDTMIAMLGCCISTKRYEDAQRILRTFQQYERRGMLPNMFPEQAEEEPLYNTVDASLLFIDVVYQLYQADGDLDFVQEMYPTMKSIVSWYEKGTDFHIQMCEDGLISAGDELEQLTWMDIRFGDILPTPRHGKPVEINAYWYNALRIMDIFSTLFQEDSAHYITLAEERVKPNFLSLFWDDELHCLKDVISSKGSNSHADRQIRLNQVWALSMPFTMIDENMGKQILEVIFEKLYTPWGLRSLDPNDQEFKPWYGGSHFHRDMSYHQGTVWGFPLGAYYLAYLRYGALHESTISTLERQLSYTQTALEEGCLGQIAEIYDGKNPHISQGCFAQAWSVGELLRVYEALERRQSQ